MTERAPLPRDFSLGLAGDVALAVAILVAAYASISSDGSANVGLYGLATAAIVPLAVRRFHPVPVLGLAAAGTAYAAADGSWWPFAALVAFYSVGAHAPRRTAMVAG